MTVTTKKPRPQSRITRKPRSPLWRLRILQVLFLFFFVAIAIRLYYLQVLNGNKLQHKAFIQRQQNNILVHRGTITDRHGLPLAIDTTRYDVYIHKDLLKMPILSAAKILADITRQKEESILSLLENSYPIVTPARHIEAQSADELLKLNWTGLDVVPRPFRHYPEGHLAAHVLGYVNFDAMGQGGIEQKLEEDLKDTGSIPKPQLDGRGHPIVVLNSKMASNAAPPIGSYVELTVDNYLQHLAEKELQAMVVHSVAQRGTAIILEPSSGEILAWANYPFYDPNHYAKYPFSFTKNFAMVDVYQPGSTFKILTVACALDAGTINEHSTFADSSGLTIGNRTIHNHDGGHGTLDLLHFFIHSSNVVAGKIALTMTPKQFYERLRNFGIGKPTGMDLPGESSGILTRYKYWQPLDLATTGFGQGAVAVTPLQLVAAVGAVANNGVYMQPHIIKRIYDPISGVTKKWTEVKTHQVISAKTARLVTNLLAQNIAMGSQIAGQVPGYSVAGKTGTAQKPIQGGHGYIAGQTIASFIGYFPAQNPQLLCLVVVDGPQTDGRWGNTVAGPVFNAIATEAARYLGIVPDPQLSKGSQHPQNDYIAPSVKYKDELAKKENKFESR